MARRKTRRDPRSGAPAITPPGKRRGPDASATTMAAQTGEYGNFLDPNHALKVIPHPSEEWADFVIQPVKPREKFE